jgi:hypothetical protein
MVKKKGCSEKTSNCVKDLMSQGHTEESAYAICNKSLNKSEILFIDIEKVRTIDTKKSKY